MRLTGGTVHELFYSIGRQKDFQTACDLVAVELGKCDDRCVEELKSRNIDLREQLDETRLECSRQEYDAHTQLEASRAIFDVLLAEIEKRDRYIAAVKDVTFMLAIAPTP